MKHFPVSLQAPGLLLLSLLLIVLIALASCGKTEPTETVTSDLGAVTDEELLEWTANSLEEIYTAKPRESRRNTSVLFLPPKELKTIGLPWLVAKKYSESKRVYSDPTRRGELKRCGENQVVVLSIPLHSQRVLSCVPEFSDRWRLVVGVTAGTSPGDYRIVHLQRFRSTEEMPDLEQECQKLLNRPRVPLKDRVETLSNPPLQDYVVLDVSDVALIDEDMEQLRSPDFKRVETVVLADQKSLTPRGIAQLRHLKSLKRLDLSNTAVSAEALSALVDLPIERLNLSGTKLDDEAAAFIAELPLVELNVSDTNLGDGLLVELSKANRDITTRIFGELLGDLIFDKKYLSNIDLTRTKVTDKGLEHLSQISYLSSATLDGTAVTDSAIRKLRDSHPFVRTSSPSALSFQDKRPEPEPKDFLKDGTILAFPWDTPVDDQFIASLDRSLFERAEEVCLEGTSITDKTLEFLSQFENLAKIYLAYTSVTDEGIALLRDLPNLTYLDLESTEVTLKGLASLEAYWASSSGKRKQ